MLTKRSITIGLLILLFIAAGGGILACRKISSSNAVNPSSNPAAESISKKTSDADFADDDEHVIKNFDRALDELDEITSSCDREDWQVAGEHYEIFRQVTRKQPQPKLSHPDVSLALLDAFDLYNVQLEQAIADEDWTEATFASNQLTNILSDLITQLQTNNAMEARRELRRLIFLNREMQLWAKRGNEKMLKMRAKRLRSAWNDLRPVIFDHHGAEAAEQFDAVANRLEKIESIDDYQNISSDLSNAVSALTTVFIDNH